MVEKRSLTDQLHGLAQILATGALQDNVQRSGERLLQRLNTPVRVVLMGPDDTSKSSLLQALTGQIIPRIGPVPIYLGFGVTGCITYRFEDGTTEVSHDLGCNELPTRTVVHVDIKAANPLLRNVSFCARPLADLTEMLVNQGTPPFDDAEIVLWCTNEFALAEATLWQQAPNRLKDHSFLVPITTADAAGGVFSQELMNALYEVADEEFLGLFPVVLDQDISVVTNVTVESLAAEISRLAQSGRHADEDNAALFVEKYKALLPQSLLSLETPPERNDQKPASPVTPVDPADLVSDTHLTALYHKALCYIRDRASELADPLPTEDSNDLERVLTHCHETSETVSEMFSEISATDPDFLNLREDILCVADKLLLISMESGLTPAVDAVTTLLQTRRELEVRIAA